MKRCAAVVVALVVCLISVEKVHAKGAGSSGGLTLLEAPGARAAALGEAFSSALDDVSAFAYNPATLQSLKSGQALFLHQTGVLDDAYSQFMIGGPWHQSGLGLSIGYYNGGEFQLSDGVSERNVTAQTDLLIALGMARTVGRVSLGVTGKYLSSELVETAHATALAADFGLNFAVSPRLSLGGAMQNFGTELKFEGKGDELPRTLRFGGSYELAPQSRTSLLFDVRQLLNENETEPGLGVETHVGPLALRAGYRHGPESKEFSMGTGFSWSRSTIDYSFGLSAQELDAQHRIAYSFRFGGTGGLNAPFVRHNKTGSNSPSLSAMVRPTSDQAPYVVTPKERAPKTVKAASNKRRLYTVKPGDNLAKIAQTVYGDPRLWRNIYMANRHLIATPTEIEVGQKIALP